MLSTVMTRPILRALSFAGLALAVMITAGCGSSASVYRDPTYHFSFTMPSGWSAPSSGKVQPTASGQGYVLQFTKPPGMAITVQAPVPGLTSIRNGEVITNNPGRFCPVKCIYYHVRISGRPGILIRRFNPNGTLSDEFAVTNTPRHSYQLLIRAVTMTRSLDAGFRKIASTFRIMRGK
jgi:hypothetical protein